MAEERFRVNAPTVIHQTIDGEVVIIHLDRGLYYSLDVLGAEIWDRLAAGSSPDQVAQSLGGGFATDQATFSDAVSMLVERLRSEELIVPVAEMATHESPSDGVNESPPEGAVETGTRSFSPPLMQRYDDLQELLLLDPIHAVDESGWPERPRPTLNQAG
ncbi:hypothetical protein BH20CHL6_BH20CHL6_04900 [soil metagenome]